MPANVYISNSLKVFHKLVFVLEQCRLLIKLWLMIFGSNGNSFPYKNGVEGEVVGSRSIGCV
jgi:hypothetical protein